MGARVSREGCCVMKERAAWWSKSRGHLLGEQLCVREPQPFVDEVGGGGRRMRRLSRGLRFAGCGCVCGCWKLVPRFLLREFATYCAGCREGELAFAFVGSVCALVEVVANFLLSQLDVLVDAWVAEVVGGSVRRIYHARRAEKLPPR